MQNVHIRGSPKGHIWHQQSHSSISIVYLEGQEEPSCAGRRIWVHFRETGGWEMKPQSRIGCLQARHAVSGQKVDLISLGT